MNADEIREQFRRDESTREFNNETNRWWNNFYFWQAKQVDRDTERAAERGREAQALAYAGDLPPGVLAGVGEELTDGLRELRGYVATGEDLPRGPDVPPLVPGSSGEPGADASVPGPREMLPSQAGVPGPAAASPPSAAPPLLPEALADPVLRDLLPPDPDTAARLLNDLTVMGDRIDAATALRASGDAARAQEAEYAARQIYDFWSAFYRNQERIALIAERLHELSVETVDQAEESRRATGMATSSATDDRWFRLMLEGNNYNKARLFDYQFREVIVEHPDGHRYRVDAHNVGEEIISRKLTQFAQISGAKGIEYLREAVRQYAPGTPIARVDSNKGLLAITDTLEGQLILEVPLQREPIPEKILKAAKELGVIIRDHFGNIYQSGPSR